MTPFCSCEACKAMMALANTMYDRFIAGHVPCDMAAQAAAVALALACSNADDAEALLDDACKTASDYLTTITTVH